MNPETKTRIAEEAASAEFFTSLPNNIRGFALKKIFDDELDKFNYFRYEKDHRSLTAYFHEETAEYKVRVSIGLNEFCLTKFFTGDFKRFTELLRAELDSAIENLTAPVTDSLLAEKNFADWEYAKTLPKNLEGFELFISPDNPAKTTNGSYILLNYSDFDAASDFSVFYNVYTENFTGESKIRLVPHVSYLFDAVTLKELEAALEKNLAAELNSIKNFSNG
ncbi:MAG: hypothetical protein J5809_06435 [Selenomonadaceae bacterium]|nr:hypothetical protein [Selenomonadaceae bacterium]